MNYIFHGRQMYRNIYNEQMIVYNILQALWFNKKVAFASPNKIKMKDKVIKMLDDNSVEYKIEDEKIIFDSNGQIEFI